MPWGYFQYPEYVSVGARKEQAAREIAKLRKAGKDVSPVKLEGRAIATTFWGKAWCKNLERYSDYENRLPRGRSYVRSGAVVDLQIAKGKVSALVRGTELYTVEITVSPVQPARWKAIVDECAGGIGSVIELLQAKLSRSVMEVISREGTGLFPVPGQIRFRCTCPDSASLCKHVAATLYGVGARFDEAPELLFQLAGVSMDDLVSRAAAGAVTAKKPPAKKTLHGDLASVFGIELDMGPAPSPAPPKRTAKKRQR